MKSLEIRYWKTQRILEVDFIIDCRNGKKHAYDIVIGAMADDQIYNYISDYLDGSYYKRTVLDIGKI